MIGIIGYGAYVPKNRIRTKEIARIWGKDPKNVEKGLGVFEKSVPSIDEDTITIATAAAKCALKRAGIDPKEIGAIYIGSESHPYVVKPSGTVVAAAIGCEGELRCADYEFACKAGTAAIQNVMGLIEGGYIKYGLAIGADTSQGAPGDALEYSTSAGGAAFILGKKNKDSIATIEETLSYTTDTPDFWRREYQHYPQHGGRFTGEPAYFKHVGTATKMMIEKMSITPENVDYVVFHMPNAKFPMNIAKKLGFSKEQVSPSLVVTEMGNAYSGSSVLGLTAVLDVAKPGDKILMTSYGSGAGSDSFYITVNDAIENKRDVCPKTWDMIHNKRYIDYATYTKYRRKILMR
ncbi:MAG: hydroxymethylglutaryl-CoA synthase [Methanomicrobia archaeon]|nr:hydroxymethylglutaryl-CoA synthase [Methanomicrobia archaeon]RLF94366.1 MAG: hydroxymethylglutaryl-CoA synthase [Thermococci archaeon]RLF96185.1 MAG: hydroxymethylglutaryl-CoA synthase [Thermococci archaeon]HDN81630.1 hydroxymethylglutaryl-CoA synthase [Methanomicrobia archaeon]